MTSWTPRRPDRPAARRPVAGRRARDLALVGAALAASALAVTALGACRAAGAPGRVPTTAPDSSAASRTATSEEWRGRSVARPEELMVGRFPGVQVLSMPGQGIAVRIRGASSLRGSNDPLYVIDGMPHTPGPDGLLSINPNDIAKIQVLKDAAQLAEYGSRGANGVVVITTKRGP